VEFSKVSARLGNGSVKCQVELHVQTFVEFALSLSKMISKNQYLYHYLKLFSFENLEAFCSRIFKIKHYEFSL